MTRHRADDISEKLLDWYDRHERDLPWRQTDDPYAIWVAEVMLQQTQVETVIPYYHRFLERFPTGEALAKTSLDDVLKAWEGMGYYARARNLHAAAREVDERFEGKIPEKWDQLISLPGIGPYTAGAILSIAFGEPVPAVDGNVRRVLSRLFAIEDPVDQSQIKRQLWELAAELLPQEHAGRYNQALMDLGAMVCTPRKPTCLLCPVSDFCKAYQQGLQEELPAKTKRKPIPHHNVTAGVIWDEDRRLLIAQRPTDGLLGGLWKFPGGRQNSGESLEECLPREIREELGIQISVKGQFTSVHHAYTHFQVTVHAFHCTHEAGKPQALGCRDCRWVSLDELDEFAFPKVDREVISVLRQGE